MTCTLDLNLNLNLRKDYWNCYCDLVGPGMTCTLDLNLNLRKDYWNCYCDLESGRTIGTVTVGSSLR